MESENRLPLVLRILLPFIFVLLAPISPLAESAREAWTSARQAAREEISLPAAQGFSRAAQMYPWRGDLWEQAAVWQMNAGSTERAEASFASAEQAGGLSAQGRLARADLWVQMGRIDEGREQYLRLGSAAGQAESIYADTAARLLEAGNLDGYARVLDTWQISHPRSADALFAWGQWLVVSRPEAALRPLLQAASLQPALARDVAELQSALTELEETQDVAYRLTLQGQALGRVGSWTLARACFDQAVQAVPEYAEAWALLGEARQQTGQDGKAELERALQLNPQSQIALALTAQYWRRQNKPQEALTALSDLRRLYPRQAVWFAETGSALAAGGDLINAFAYYQQAVEVEPENALTWRVLAAFSVEYGVDVRTVGLPAARRAAALAPEDAQAQDVLGWTLLNLGDRITAERILQRAAALDGSSNLIRYHLGQLYFLRGLPDTAERYLRAVVSGSASNDPLRDAALRLLRRMGRE